MVKRNNTKKITIGNKFIGSGSDILIQSMTKTKTEDILSTVKQIKLLEKNGCEIIRVAVKTLEAAEAIKEIKNKIDIPIVADIHFDHKLAIKSINSGADKIRINPGNIDSCSKLKEIIAAASYKNIPIRIGVNSGSFRSNIPSKEMATKMCDLAMKNIDYFNKNKFYDLVLSLKASDVVSTVEAYRMISEKTDVPLHLGITSAGDLQDGIIKSSVGIGTLLLEGIGDTLRVSLTEDPIHEVSTAKRILESAGLRYFDVNVISCPTCGRCQVDVIGMIKKLKKICEKKSQNKGFSKPVTIAVMGCEVNGPGEAMHADIGIAFGKNSGVIFKKGKKIRTVSVSEGFKEIKLFLESV